MNLQNNLLSALRNRLLVKIKNIISDMGLPYGILDTVWLAKFLIERYAV